MFSTKCSAEYLNNTVPTVIHDDDRSSLVVSTWRLKQSKKGEITKLKLNTGTVENCAQ